MSPRGSITATRLWKRFRPDKRPQRLRGFLDERRAGLRAKRSKQWVWALRDVEFHAEPGESLGLIGANGSGKSTLLKILTRVMYPYAGSVEAVGRVGALIEVAAGIHPQLSGRENIYVYGSLLGLHRSETAKRFDDIVEFAEVGHAIDRLIKFYSSGMKMRLGFAVAAFLEPDILLVDEVLAVGDAQFQRRCLNRLREVLSQGTTLAYVSHDLPTVEATCSRALWLDRGVLRRDGPVRDVLADYREAIEEEAALELLGGGAVQASEVTACGPDGGPPRTGEPLHVRFVLGMREAADATVHIGVSEGPAMPILHVRRDVGLPAGNVLVGCTLDDVPLARGRFYVWIGVQAKGRRTRDLLAWSPAAHFDVVGPDLEPVPSGVVRAAPVYTSATWNLE